ncbi:hypothetical protein [Propionivibrio limicola]|uniref:hypothetical protein n=1 Tax=Propionivibrio limicola TaxID=167645 RepID=UPI001292657B|nr:hypothetical protein [Propionivibrio limicola]
MNPYASIKGRATAPATAAKATTPARALSDAEIERVAENRAFVRENMPELVDFIRDLHANGLIDGWRAVTNCTMNERES